MLFINNIYLIIVVTETPKKKKRIICDIKTPDFSTPRTSRKSIKLAKTKTQMQENKIKILN